MKMINIIAGAMILAVGAIGCNNTTNDIEYANTEYKYFPLPADMSNVVTSEDQRFVVQEVVSGLGVPWGIAFLPDGSVLITERAGTLRLVRNGQLLSEPVGNVPEVFARGQGGLLDVVIHPNYEQNGWIYLSYSQPVGDVAHTAIMRARLDGTRLVDNEVIFSGEPKTNRGHHFGSRIVFDNDGYLFFAIGDRGDRETAQELNNHNGKTFRIYDDGRVPADNPFVNTPGAKPEIFSYGNRNIQGMTLHPETGQVWSHEHGPRGGDEINIIEAGKNYGWPAISFGINYDGTIITPDTARAGMEQPLHYWTPSIAPAGMTFITGDKYPGWKGNLFSGSLSFRYLHRTVLDGTTVVKEERLLEDIGRVRDVRQAPDGYIYFSTEDGKIHRLIPVN